MAGSHTFQPAHCQTGEALAKLVLACCLAVVMNERHQAVHNIVTCLPAESQKASSPHLFASIYYTSLLLCMSLLKVEKTVQTDYSDRRARQIQQVAMHLVVFGLVMHVSHGSSHLLPSCVSWLSFFAAASRWLTASPEGRRQPREYSLPHSRPDPQAACAGCVHHAHTRPLDDCAGLPQGSKVGFLGSGP